MTAKKEIRKMIYKERDIWCGANPYSVDLLYDFSDKILLELELIPE